MAFLVPQIAQQAGQLRHSRKLRVIQSSCSRNLRLPQPHRFGNYGLTPLGHVEIRETPTSLVLTAQMPPLSLEQITIHLTAKTLEIAGERWERVHIPGYCDLTYPSLQFVSRFRLPQLVQSQGFTVAIEGTRLILTLLKRTPQTHKPQPTSLRAMACSPQ